MELRDYQRDAVAALSRHLAEHDDNPVVVLPTGCHARGTLILMHDGSTKPVEAVGVGDRLMGPDSAPRQVLALARGREPLYRITPKKGEPFVVNEGHVLSLQATNEGKGYPCNTTGTEVSNVSVRDWLSRSRYWRHLRKLRRAAVDFPPRQRPDLDPWTLGALLGDGSLRYGVRFTKPDPEILDAVWAEMRRHGLEYTARQRNGGLAWHVSFSDPQANRVRPNRVTAILRALGIYGCDAASKFVPQCYKLGARADRLALLAGLLDTDGHLSKGGFDFVSKSERLARDVEFIARSVGLAAYCKPCEKFCQTGNGGTYWRVLISGETQIIPTKCPRKQASPKRGRKKNVLVTGFVVEPVGEGEFFGFTLDGDHLYLSADFTVHHNSGKSIVMAALIREYVGRWPATRILILAHVKELVSQNADKLGRYWREAPIGIHSAGLGRRDTRESVIFASVQSVYRNAARLGRFDLIFIDEAHRIPLAGEGMYRRLLADLGALNPALRVVGFTATPYRMGAGRVYGPDYLLNAVAYEAGVKDLIAEGYLSPLVSKGGRTRADLSAVHLRQGEYVAEELEAALTRGDLVARAVAELVRLAADRRAWLVFCAGVRHAEAVSAALAGHGIEAPVVHAGTPREVRDALIARYQRQELRALVNVNVLSEGFDAPHVDCVVLLRPTKSAGLFVQQVGRGLRLAPGKTDALILDFAGNIAEHGPIDTIRARRARAPGEALTEGAPTRMCPECQTILPAATQRCPCGYEWPAPEPRHADTPSGIPVLSTWEAPERFRVDHVEYLLHHKPGKPPSLRVDYHCGLRRFSEWICFEHGGFARAKAERWWARRRLPGARPDDSRALPADTAAALAEARAGALRAPVAILVSLSGKYPEITRHELAPEPRAEAADARDPGAGHRDRAGAA